jgi:hypothetical protein
MAGNIIDSIQITHEEVTQHLLRQMSIIQFDLAVARAENDKLKQVLNDSVINNISKHTED